MLAIIDMTGRQNMKWTLITGATSGIGLAFAKYYSSLGYGIILVSERKKELDKVSAMLISDYSIPTISIDLDLSLSHAATKLYQIVKEKEIIVDVLINGAAFGIKGKYLDTSLEKIQKLMHLQLQSVSELTYLFLHDMIKQNHGDIINIASVSAYNPSPYNAVYAACKSYLLSLTSAIHYEYKDTPIRILALCPMATKTSFFDEFPPLSTKMMRTPEQVVKTTIKALEKNKMMAVDGFLGNIQAFLPHFASLPIRVKANAWVCHKWKDIHHK